MTKGLRPFEPLDPEAVHRGVLGRLLGTGSVRLVLRDGPGEGQLAVTERDTPGSEDVHELYLHSLVDAGEIAAYIERRTGASRATD